MPIYPPLTPSDPPFFEIDDDFAEPTDGLSVAGLTVANTFTVGGQVIQVAGTTVGLDIQGDATHSGDIYEGKYNGTLVFSVSFRGAGLFDVFSSETNTIVEILSLGHNTDATAADGFGANIGLYLESSTTADQSAGSIEWSWATATHASRKARIVIYVYDTAVREAVRIDTDGSGAQISFFGAGSYGSGRGVIFLANAGAAPSSNPTGGGILYSTGGAGTWRGSGGTTTTFGPAGPHCGACGADFWRTCYVNERWGAELRECGWCGKVYRKGPQTFFHLLTAEQQAELLPG